MAEPKIRFRRDDGSSYPEWKTIPMSDIFTEISEKNHPEMAVLSVQQGVGTVLRNDSERNIQYDKSNLKNYKALQKDDFIIHLRSFEGGLECSRHNGISSPAYRILRSHKIIPAAYRDYFRSYDFIHNKLAVAVVGIRDGKNIDMDTFWQIPITIASMEEQQKIADFLSTIDEVIACSKQEVANLEAQKKAVMKKIFSQEVRFKREDGSDFPEWENVSIRDIGTVVTGNTPPTKEKDNYGGDYLWVTPADIVANQYVYNTGKKLSDKGWAVARHLPAGSVLVTCIASIGKNSILAADGSCNQQINAIVPNGKMVAHFALEAINYKEHDLQLLVGNGGMKIVSKSLFENFDLPFPCHEEQCFIADFLSDFNEAISTAKKELDLWKQLKKGLIQLLFV